MISLDRHEWIYIALDLNRLLPTPNLLRRLRKSKD